MNSAALRKILNGALSVSAISEIHRQPQPPQAIITLRSGIALLLTHEGSQSLALPHQAS